MDMIVRSHRCDLIKLFACDMSWETPHGCVLNFARDGAAACHRGLLTGRNLLKFDNLTDVFVFSPVYVVR